LIRLVVALGAEARPLIRRFGLERAAAGQFPVWRRAGVSLVICGIGRAAAAEATACLAGDGHAVAAAWLNVGIGGHRTLPLGEVILPREVIDASGGPVWHPRVLFEPPCPTATVTTVDRAELEYPEETVYEMEAAGFCSSAARFATAESIQVVKVISDNAAASPERLTAGRVEELIETRIETIASIAEQAAALASPSNR
jgi:nucleoside phosphorylase